MKLLRVWRNFTTILEELFNETIEGLEGLKNTVENLGETNEVLEELHKNTEGTSEETRG